MAYSNTLTERESQVFEAFRYLDRTQKATPTQREIAAFLNCNPSVVCRAFDRLESKGFIGSTKVNDNRSPRSYRITNFRRTRKKVRQ